MPAPKTKIFQFPQEVEKTIEDILKLHKRENLYLFAKYSWELAEVFQKGVDYSPNVETVLPYLFYFFPKTFTANYLVFGTIIDEIEKKIGEKGEILFYDISAGTGSASSAFVYLLKERKTKGKIKIVLQDISISALDIAEKIIERIKGKTHVETKRIVSDAARLTIKDKPDIAVCSFSLYDIFRDSVDDMISWCSKILKSLSDDGLFIVIEPALKSRNSLFLMKIRDALKDFVIAPCTHNLNCPMLKRDDWCHFGGKWKAPFYLTRGMNMVRGRPPDINFSYLILSRKNKEKKENLARIVSHNLEEKGRIVFWTCERGMKVKYYILKRNITEKNKSVEILHMGDAISIRNPIEKGEERGYKIYELNAESEVEIKEKLFPP